MADDLIYPTISEGDFEQLVLMNSNIPTVVVFTADWLGEGTMMDAIVEGVAEDYRERANFYRVDIEESKNISHQLGIRRLPAIFLFLDGELRDHFTGMSSRVLLEQRLDSIL